MARLARVVAPGLPHHVTQRGNRGQKVFFSDGDRWAYLEFVADAAGRFGVRIWAWCLMPNHVHFVAVPERENSLALCFGRAHTRYTRRVNLRKGVGGYLWQGRFASSPMDEPHLYAVVRYVERNPVRAGLVRLPWRYEWSSAAYHARRAESDPLVEDDERLTSLIGDWRDYLKGRDDEEYLRSIRSESAVGRPLGDEDFVSGLEKLTGKRLRRRPRGRRRKRHN